MYQQTLLAPVSHAWMIYVLQVLDTAVKEYHQGSKKYTSIQWTGKSIFVIVTIISTPDPRPGRRRDGGAERRGRRGAPNAGRGAD